jgi:hypothetical protein
MITDERFHLYCKRVSKKDDNLMQQEQEQILINAVESRSELKNKFSHEKLENDTVNLPHNRWDDHLISSFPYFIRSIYDNQDQLNEQLKRSSISLSSSYLSTFFEYLKLINNYWMKAYTNSSRLIENKLNPF